jgi:HAD superfamily hydrolase (TIGR01450 family)
MKYVLDIDGTIIDGQTLNLDSKAFVSSLERRHIDYLLMTNSVSSPNKICERLFRAGIEIAPGRILNPIIAINEYIKNQRIVQGFVVGGPEHLLQLEIIQDEREPQIVVLIDFEKNNASYEIIQKAYCYIQRGIPMVSASGSKYYLKDGIRHIDTGAFVSLFDALSDNPTLVLGKPSLGYFEVARSKLSCGAGDLIVVGDDWSTDIAGALNFGAKAILIRSGKYIDGDEKKVAGAICVGNFSEITIS